MAVKLLNIDKIKQLKWPALILTILIIIAIIYFPNYAKRRKLRRENQRMSDEIMRLEAEIADYEEKIGNLGDPYLYEKIARDDLGVARENEIVIDIEE